MTDIEDDIRGLDEIYTIAFNEGTGSELNPDARIWYGFTEVGDPFTKIIPILVHKHDEGPEEAVEYFRGFSEGSSAEYRIKPVSYTTDTSTSHERVKLVYDMKPVPENAATDEFRGDPVAMANYWKDNVANSAVTTSLTQISSSVYRLYLSINIFTQPFKTYVPFFTENPSGETLHHELENLTIPCLTVVPENTDYTSVVRKFPTRVEPGIMSIE